MRLIRVERKEGRNRLETHRKQGITRNKSRAIGFYSKAIESSFQRLDAAIEGFKNALWRSSGLVKVKTDVIALPHFMFDGIVTTNSMTADEKAKQRQLFQTAVEKLDDVITQQRILVEQIRHEFPEFRFDADNSDLERR